MCYGQLNRRIGWTLLVAGFAWAIWLDPWSLSERDPSALVGSPRMAARHAQAVVLGMGFLQLMVGEVLATGAFIAPVRRASAWLTGAGAAVYALGYVLTSRWPVSAWLVPAGAMMNLAGFILLTWSETGTQGRQELRVVLPIICFGMLLDLVMGLFASNPNVFLPVYIGPEDGVRLRMLRLARAAIISLSLLTLYYEGLAAQGDPRSRAIRWGRIGMFSGTVGMPTILAAASFTSVRIKLFLGLPADAIFAGTIVGLWLASRYARPLEVWGWLLIVPSLAAGLLMGMYAFDGPLPAPTFLRAYNAFPRRLARLVHAYSVVLGLVSVGVARELDRRSRPGWAGRIGSPLLMAGSAAMPIGIVLHGGMGLPPGVLGVGPALVVVAILLCIVSLQAPTQHDQSERRV